MLPGGISSFLVEFAVVLLLLLLVVLLLVILLLIRPFFTTERKKIYKIIIEIKSRVGIYKLEIAICSPNCVQICKGRDRKTFFCRVRLQKCRAKGDTFFMSNPVKKLFSDRNLSI